MRVEANFAQAGLAHNFTGIILGDAAACPFRSVPIFDAIVTDRMQKR